MCVCVCVCGGLPAARACVCDCACVCDSVFVRVCLSLATGRRLSLSLGLSRGLSLSVCVCVCVWGVRRLAFACGTRRPPDGSPVTPALRLTGRPTAHRGSRPRPTHGSPRRDRDQPVTPTQNFGLGTASGAKKNDHKAAALDATPIACLGVRQSEHAFGIKN